MSTKNPCLTIINYYSMVYCSVHGFTELHSGSPLLSIRRWFHGRSSCGLSFQRVASAVHPLVPWGAINGISIYANAGTQPFQECAGEGIDLLCDTTSLTYGIRRLYIHDG